MGRLVVVGVNSEKQTADDVRPARGQRPYAGCAVGITSSQILLRSLPIIHKHSNENGCGFYHNCKEWNDGIRPRRVLARDCALNGHYGLAMHTPRTALRPILRNIAVGANKECAGLRS